MRQLLQASLAACLALLGAESALATPVYLRIDSRFPSGHHPRSWLESRTRGVQFQRWMRVETRDQAYGWVPEDHLLTPLRLVETAILTADVPARKQSQLDAVFNRPILPKDLRVAIQDINGSWARVRVPRGELRPDSGLGARPGFLAATRIEPWQDLFIPTENLTPDAAGTTRAFVHTPSAIRSLPGLHAREIGRVADGLFLQILSRKSDWLEVRSPMGTGFMRRADAWTLEDLQDRNVRPLLRLVALRSAPLPYADLIRQISPSVKLKVIEEKPLRWGQAQVPGSGLLWWPIADDDDEKDVGGARAAPKIRLATQELFARKIFDMAASRAIPSLKFVSAQGVFRTIDGEEWTKLPQFQDQNYPIAIAENGTVFIGPYVSDDHGETFQQWIRWDTLVATLAVQNEVSARNIQILDIHPQDSSGRRVSLRLGLGLHRPVQLVTYDQGMSWRAN